MMVPNRRPPSPHSGKRVRSPAFHRAATKPRTVTSRKKKAKMMVAVQSIIWGSTGLQVDDENQDRRDRDPKELIPIEERESEQGRFTRVVERHPEQGDKGHEQEKSPQA